jgi:glycosyltransferase involved in cell wall biosynthesis
MNTSPASDIVIVGTYPPTTCGLATFTDNLRRAMSACAHAANVSVLQLNAPADAHTASNVLAVWPRGGSPALAAHHRRNADAVEFDDAYRSWSEVYDLARRCDVVVLPYDSREQVTSGVLVEALACGPPIIATAFPHAVEALGSGAGIVVPHEEPDALATAMATLLDDDALRQYCARIGTSIGIDAFFPTATGPKSTGGSKTLGSPRSVTSTTSSTPATRPGDLSFASPPLETS